MSKQVRYDQCLTNENLSKQSRSQFELVSKAIKIAQYLVESGKATEEWPDNISFEVLRKICEEGMSKLEQEVYAEEE